MRSAVLLRETPLARRFGNNVKGAPTIFLGADVSNLIVRGGRPLKGRITPSANKNAVLPILCATLLTDETVTLRGVPDITDVHQILGLFEALGSQVEWDHAGQVVRLNHAGARSRDGVSLPEGMRSSI